MRNCRNAAAVLACWLGVGLGVRAQYDPVPVGPSGNYPYTSPNYGGPIPPGEPGFAPPGAPPGPSPADLQHRQPMPEKFMKELMQDNGPSAWEDERRYTNPVRAQFSLDYLLMMFRSNRTPALVTTGNPNEAALGSFANSNTRVVFGNQNTGSGLAQGFKVSGLFYVVDPEVVALEANYFLMEQRSFIHDVTSDPNGNPVLARPFFDPSTGLESARVIANPGTNSGSAHDSFTTTLQGAEANLSYNVTGNNFNDGGNLILLAGARWINLREQYYNYDVSQTLPVAGGIKSTFSDTFNTSNQFIGGQLGSKVRIRKGRSAFDIIGKLAVGPNFQRINAIGYNITTTNLVPPAVVTDRTQGFYVRGTNSGETIRTLFAVAPEMGLNWAFELNDNIKFNVGYTLLLMNNVVRPDSVINTNLATNPGSNGIYQPSRENLRGDSTFWLQTINIGLELSF